MKTSEVTRNGRVTIPEEIREKLGVRPGDEVTFAETEAGIVIRKAVPEDRFGKWRGVADADQSVEERMAALRGFREES